MGCARKLVFSWGGNPGRRLAAPAPRRGRAGLAGAARDRGALARRHGDRVRGGRGEPPVRRPARLPRRRPAGADAGRDDRVPVHGRAARGGARPPARRRHRPRPAGRPARQRPALGDHRRPEGDGARVARARSPRSRRSSTSWSSGRAASSCRRGCSTPCRSRPRGAHPSYAHDYYDRDNDFYVAWDAVSRDRETFRAWMQRHVLDTADVGEYHASLAAAAKATA